MKILVINAGSSSVKYQLFDMENETVLANGICERIGIEGGAFKHKVPGREDYKVSVDMKNHSEAIKLVVDTLVSKENGVIASMSEIDAVGHRVLHGGEKFSGSVVINENVIKAIEDCCELGPLHNPHNLTGIHACEEIMGKDVPQVAVFDTGFHQTMPDYAYMYPLPYEYYEKYKIRRYGFHGTSHRYVSQRAAALLGKDPKDVKVITCHLGNGSSVAAVEGGKCIDTSMGLTPLEGLMMGTRCGSIDPAIVPFLMEREGWTPAEADNYLNKKCGFLGVSEISSDSRDIEAAILEGNPLARRAAFTLAYQIKKYIGSYTAAMDGVDAIVWTAGMGENNTELRERACAGLEFFGVKIDNELNAKIHHQSETVEISTADSKVKVVVLPTNEELMIASDTEAIVSAL